MSSTKTDSTKDTPSRKERVDQTFFDTDFFDDSKIEEIEELFGDAAPCYYQRIAFRILKEGGPIRFSGAVAILKKRQIGERAEAFLNACIEIGLFYREGDLISSSRADREIESLRDKRDKWRKKKRPDGDSPKTPTRFEGDSPGNPPRIRGDSEKEQEEEKEKEEEGKRNQGEVQEGEPPRPASKPVPDANRNGPAPPDDPTEHLDPKTREFLPMAERALRPADAAEVMIRNGFINCGRRPIRKYPDLWITPHDLADAWRQCIDAGVPKDRIDVVFAKAAAHSETKIARGQDPSTFNAHGWIIGFGLTEGLKQLTQENYHKRSLANGGRR